MQSEELNEKKQLCFMFNVVVSCCRLSANELASCFSKMRTVVTAAFFVSTDLADRAVYA